MVGAPIRGNGPGSAKVDSLLVDTSTKLGSSKVPAPIFTASGCAASGKELDQYFDVLVENQTTSIRYAKYQ
jgi:hypothetical protein